jgi:hypothetical protein
MGIQYQPLTASVRELNRMLIEKQAWDSEFKLREADRGLKNMMTMSQLKSSQQQQQMAQYQLAEQERLHTPTLFQMNKFPVFQGNPEFLEEFESNPAAMEKFRKTFDDQDVGYKYSPADKTWRHPISNEPYAMTPYESQFRVPGMMGIIDGTVDTVASMKKTQGQLAEQIVAIDKDIAKARKGQYSKQAVQELTRQRQGLATQYKEATNFLSPEGLLKHYSNQEALSVKRAMLYHQIQAPELAAEMQRNADNAAKSKNIILDNLDKAKSDSSKITGQVKLFAIKPITHNGKKYEIGSTRLERWLPGESNKNYDPEYWSTEDPLTKEKREGKGSKASFTYKASTDKYAKDVADSSMFGSMTAPQKKLLRDAMDIGHKAEANRLGVGADDDNSDVYVDIKIHFAQSHENYWKMKEAMASRAWIDNPITPDGRTLLEVAVSENPKIATMGKKQQRAAVIAFIEETFHKNISSVTGGDHQEYLPSPTTRTQQKQ